MISWRGAEKFWEVAEASVSKTTQLDSGGDSPGVQRLVHGTWGQLPPGSSVFAFLPVEQISLEKAGKVALME